MESTTQPDKKEIIQLLLADMRNRKLLTGLENAGLSTADFGTDLSCIIMQKMGLNGKEDEAMYIWYETVMHSILEHELSYFREKQHYLARRVYDMLLEKMYELHPMRTKARKAAAQRLLDWFIKKCYI